MTMDAVVLNCVTQFNIVWCVKIFPFLPMSKFRQKTRCITVAESLFLKSVSIANARCSSNQRSMMTTDHTHQTLHNGGSWVPSLQIFMSRSLQEHFLPTDFVTPEGIHYTSLSLSFDSSDGEFGCFSDQSSSSKPTARHSLLKEINY